MDRINLKQCPAFVLFPAFTTGVVDSINPCGLASVLIFIMYLSLVGCTQYRMVWLGMVFVVISWITHFLMVWGVFDHIITIPSIIVALRVIYFMFAAVFLVLGFANVADRLQYEKYHDLGRFRCSVPAFLKTMSDKKLSGKKRRFFVYIRYILIAMAGGFVVTLIGSLYPQSEYIFIVHSYLMSSGDARFALLTFYFYSAASVLPLVITWLVVVQLGKARNKTKVILYYKGASAALFLSIGIGLVYFLVR